MEITKIFTFDSAHYLTDYHGKCEKLHGHTYKLEITIEGPVQKNGMVLDFGILKSLVQTQVLDHLDHKLINDILENPSSEHLVLWIWKQLSPLTSLLKQELKNPNLPKTLKKFISVNDGTINIEGNNAVKLKKIILWETPTSFVSYEGK